MSEAPRLRGYVSSRPFFGERAPQHVQNLVIRDFCRRAGYAYLLSATEYAMPGCFMILQQVLNELPRGGGIAAYSLFMLPKGTERRLDVYHRVLDAGASFHAAVEGLSVFSEGDIRRVEDIWQVRHTMATSAMPDLAALS